MITRRCRKPISSKSRKWKDCLPSAALASKSLSIMTLNLTLRKIGLVQDWICIHAD